MSNRFLKYLSFSLIFLLYFLFLFHKIDLSTADLGRHIVNGKIILTTQQIPTTNYYSFSEPNFPTLNHHWLSGVIFFLIYSLSGFSGLSIFFITVSLLTLYFFLKSTKLVQLVKRSPGPVEGFDQSVSPSSWPLVSLISLLALPLLAQRTEIRPEMFSYLFCGMYLIILSSLFNSPFTIPHTPNTLHRSLSPLPSQIFQNLLGNIQYLISSIFHRQSSTNTKYQITNNNKLFLVPVLLVLQILWVNLHIYFFLGIFLVTVFSLSNLISTRFKSWRSNLSLISLITLISLINPYGIRGLLSPLTIFTNYGYRLAENQSVFFMQKLFPNFIYPYFLALLALLIISYLFCVFSTQNNEQKAKNNYFSISQFLTCSISVFFSAFAFLSIRNFALFGFFLIPLISVSLFSIRVIRDIFAKDIIKLSLLTILSLLILLTLAFTPQKHFPYWRTYGLGLETANLKSIGFYKTNDLPGPIFNNYDIGGYLIYGLYPQKVFVDNRPEAYSVDFFQKTYVPMQENATVWQERLKLYDFQTIFFGWHDMTPWGQTFLKSRLEDKAWSPVYVDNYALILLRANEANQKLINLFQIPKEAFKFN